MELPRHWASMDAEELRDLTATLIAQLAERDAQITDRDAQITERDARLATRDEQLKRKQLKIDQLTYEMATLKRWRYGKHSEQLDAVQRSLLDESIDADLEAISLEIEALQEKPPVARVKPRRVALPAAFPRREIRHEPEQTQCSCGRALERIGEDISEKLDYLPGVFEVERHIRGKWVCRRCETLIQAPVAPHIIDKGIPTAGLLAQVLIAKYLDHAPLYRRKASSSAPDWLCRARLSRSGLVLAGSNCSRWSIP
jgi:transposase